jgi:hypothetical protein
MSGPALGAPSAERLTSSVLDFRPSRHGFHFANRFPPGPTVTFGPFDPRWIGIGDASAGLCGGMAFTVGDLFAAHVDSPPDTEPPANGSPRFRSLVRRQVQSLDWLRLPLRFYDLSAVRSGQLGLFSRVARPIGDVVREQEWPRIRREIDEGRLAMLGLIRAESANPLRLVGNHQVLAYGYRVEPDAVILRLYDPNWPGRDDVEARMTVHPSASPTFESSTGEPLFGFFLAPYTPVDPRAWRS